MATRLGLYGGSQGVLPATGGTTFMQAVGGSITPTGTVDRVAVLTQVLSGAFTPTGAISRRAQINPGGSFTLAGIITRQIGRPISGTLSLAGQNAKQTTRDLSGSITPTGDLSPSLVATAAVAGTLAGLAGNLIAQFVSPPVIAAGIQKVRGWYGRRFGR